VSAVRTGQLLLKCPPEERRQEMTEIARVLEDAFGPLAGSSRMDSPGAFALDVFMDNPGTTPLVENALIRDSEDWNPVEDMDVGPTGFVLSLMPSDHHWSRRSLFPVKMLRLRRRHRSAR
jgi:hypothetical protein